MNNRFRFLAAFPFSDYPSMEIPATTFGSAILNGVVYGVIVWLIYSLVQRQRVEVVARIGI